MEIQKGFFVVKSIATRPSDFGLGQDIIGVRSSRPF